MEEGYGQTLIQEQGLGLSKPVDYQQARIGSLSRQVRYGTKLAALE